MPRKRINPGQFLDVSFTSQERDLIFERTFIDGEMAARLCGATLRRAKLIVQLTLDDVDELAGHVAAEANHCSDTRVRRVLDSVHERLARIEDTYTDEESPPPTPVRDSKPFTAKQGQYLAFIHYYTKINGRPPSEADMQAYFRVTPPSVHNMILTLDRKGLIARVPGEARSIRVLLEQEALPALE